MTREGTPHSALCSRPHLRPLPARPHAARSRVYSSVNTVNSCVTGWARFSALYTTPANPWKPEEWKNDGKARFLDLRTLAWALFNRALSLKRLCELLKTEHRKFDHEPTGTVTPDEIDYARQDGRCTVDALNGLKQEFDKHPIPLKPHSAFSPASVAKSYLDAMGIARPAEKFQLSKREMGIAMQSY